MSMFGRGNEYVHVLCFVGVDPHVMMVSISSLACPHLVPLIFLWTEMGLVWLEVDLKRIKPPSIQILIGEDLTPSNLLQSTSNRTNS
jgi:hypothetical protein